MAKIICGRTDCKHEFVGRCQLGAIAVGKDFKCQCFNLCDNELLTEKTSKEIELMQKSDGAEVKNTTPFQEILTKKGD